jgi:hypothetical protein
MSLLLSVLLLLMGKVVGGREVEKEGSSSVVAFSDKWAVFEHTRRE